MPNLLNKFKEDSKILYIYEIGLQIYGLFEGVEDRDFLIICEDNYTPIEFKNSDEIFEDSNSKHYAYKMMHVKDWFEEVLNSSIIAWECACLPKKYILKEHVKLLLQTDPLKLRKTFNKTSNQIIDEALSEFNNGNIITCQKTLWEVIKYVMFANQIIENHKIVNFKEPAELYRLIVTGKSPELTEFLDSFSKYMNPHFERFKNYTDGMIKKEITDSINKSEK